MDIIRKLKNKEAKIGIYGLGYVGLPLALRFCDEGFEVLGFDIDERKIASLKSGTSYIKTIATEDVKKHANNLLNATADFSRTQEVDAIILCVPTPLDKHREPDLSYVTSTVNSILPYLRPQQVISLESTTYPGTTREIVVPPIEKRGFKIGEDFFVAFSPEREDPGRSNFTTKTTPKVCGGLTPRCLEAGIALYAGIIDQVVPVSSLEVAEMTKLLENIHRAVNIGLVNEMKIVADRMGIDIFEVINAAATKPFGFVPYYPGPGIGGHCIPIDPFYLTWKAREFGVHTRFIELAGEINSLMPEYVVSRLQDSLNDHNLALKGAKILLLGMAYKMNVDDVRESPSLEVLDLLIAKHAKVDYCDPYIQVLTGGRKYPDLKMESIRLTPQSLKEYDAAIMLTCHDDFDRPMIAKNARLIIDTRGIFDRSAANVVRA